MSIAPPLSPPPPVARPIAGLRTIGELLSRLGDIPAERVRLYPTPGTATVDDVIRIDDHEDRLCELVDGVLVEKPMGFEESILAVAIASVLYDFVVPRNLGVVSGEAGMMQLFPGLVRIPDVAYASWARFPDGKMSGDPVPLLTPDLVVEVLSLSNTKREMKGKRGEYFASGVRLMWSVDPRARVVEVYTSADGPRVLSAADALDGGDVLPGFLYPLAELFAALDRSRGRSGPTS